MIQLCGRDEKKVSGFYPPPLSPGSYCHWGEDEALTSCKDAFKCHCLTKKIIIISLGALLANIGECKNTLAY
jgi:hypothetical protein